MRFLAIFVACALLCSAAVAYTTIEPDVVVENGLNTKTSLMYTSGDISQPGFSSFSFGFFYPFTLWSLTQPSVGSSVWIVTGFGLSMAPFLTTGGTPGAAAIPGPWGFEIHSNCQNRGGFDIPCGSPILNTVFNNDLMAGDYNFTNLGQAVFNDTTVDTKLWLMITFTASLDNLARWRMLTNDRDSGHTPTGGTPCTFSLAGGAGVTTAGDIVNSSGFYFGRFNSLTSECDGNNPSSLTFFAIADIAVTDNAAGNPPVFPSGSPAPAGSTTTTTTTGGAGTSATQTSGTQTSGTQTSATQTSGTQTSATQTGGTQTTTTTGGTQTGGTQTGGGTQTSATQTSATQTSATQTSATQTSATQTSATQTTAGSTQTTGTQTSGGVSPSPTQFTAFPTPSTTPSLGAPVPSPEPATCLVIVLDGEGDPQLDSLETEVRRIATQQRLNPNLISRRTSNPVVQQNGETRAYFQIEPSGLPQPPEYAGMIADEINGAGALNGYTPTVLRALVEDCLGSQAAQLVLSIWLLACCALVLLWL